MARNKTEKINLSFERPDLIKKLIGDIEIKENRSMSAIVEKILLESLLPKDREFKWIIENQLYSENGNIGNALADIFANNAAGTNEQAVHDNYHQLVKFAYTQDNLCNVALTGEEIDLPYVISQVNAIIRYLEFIQDNSTPEQKRDYKTEKALLIELENEPQFSRLGNFYLLILDNWDLLKNCTYTYRLLAGLCRLQKGWRSDCDARIELVEILKETAQSW